MVFTWVANAHRSLDEEISKLNHSHFLLDIFSSPSSFSNLASAALKMFSMGVGNGKSDKDVIWDSSDGFLVSTS